MCMLVALVRILPCSKKHTGPQMLCTSTILQFNQSRMCLLCQELRPTMTLFQGTHTSLHSISHFTMALSWTTLWLTKTKCEHMVSHFGTTITVLTMDWAIKESLCILLHPIGMKFQFHTCIPTSQELQNCEHILMTSPYAWNPTKIVMEQKIDQGGSMLWQSYVLSVGSYQQ
jgi:hypothetical protein